MDLICQSWIIFFGMAAIWFVGRTEKWKRWGYIFGLISQPAWIYATLKQAQWGMFILSLFYTYSWIQGIYNYWLRDKE